MGGKYMWDVIKTLIGNYEYIQLYEVILGNYNEQLESSRRILISQQVWWNATRVFDRHGFWTWRHCRVAVCGAWDRCHGRSSKCSRGRVFEDGRVEDRILVVIKSLGNFTRNKWEYWEPWFDVLIFCLDDSPLHFHPDPWAIFSISLAHMFRWMAHRHQLAEVYCYLSSDFLLRWHKGLL